MTPFITLFSYGGVSGETVDALLAELNVAARNSVPLHFGRIADDALISRSRSKALSVFLDSPCDVAIMVDHDIDWQPGDLVGTCATALETGSVVGGMYSVRRMHGGCAARLAQEPFTGKIGEDTLHAAKYVSSGFMAISRAAAVSVLEASHNWKADLKVHECVYLDGSRFYDFFRPIVVDNEYLSEDWAFCERVRATGKTPYLWSKPILRHFGVYPYSLYGVALDVPGM